MLCFQYIKQGKICEYIHLYSVYDILKEIILPFFEIWAKSWIVESYRSLLFVVWVWMIQSQRVHAENGHPTQREPVHKEMWTTAKAHKLDGYTATLFQLLCVLRRISFKASTLLLCPLSSEWIICKCQEVTLKTQNQSRSYEIKCHIQIEV